MSIFEENLKMAFSESQYDLCMKNRETDAHYRELIKEYGQLLEHIDEHLGENHELMSRLDCLQNEIESIDNDLIYLQGMIDCAVLLKLIKMI